MINNSLNIILLCIWDYKKHNSRCFRHNFSYKAFGSWSLSYTNFLSWSEFLEVHVQNHYPLIYYFQVWKQKKLHQVLTQSVEDTGQVTYARRHRFTRKDINIWEQVFHGWITLCSWHLLLPVHQDASLKTPNYRWDFRIDKSTHGNRLSH